MEGRGYPVEVRAGDRHPSCLLSHLLRGQQRSTLVCMGWGGEEVFQRFLSERDSQGLCPSGWVTASPLDLLRTRAVRGNYQAALTNGSGCPCWREAH